MVGKQKLNLMIVVLLPVVALGMGSCISTLTTVSSVGTFMPDDARAYYKKPGVNNLWFGPEVRTPMLCPGATDPEFNSGFEIEYTYERATVTPTPNVSRKVDWNRDQKWTFVFEADLPWGNSNVVKVEHLASIGTSYNEFGNSYNGHPWAGVEEHWRFVRDGDTLIRYRADRVGYQRHGPQAAAFWACPKSYVYFGWTNPDRMAEGNALFREYNCRLGRIVSFASDNNEAYDNEAWQDATHFGPVTNFMGVMMRQIVDGDDVGTGLWVPCIDLN